MRKVRKALKWLLIGVMAAVVVIAGALPFAAPPIIRHFAESKLSEFGFPSRVSMDLGYRWSNGPELAGKLGVSVSGSPWRADAEFGAGFGTWHARVTVPRTEFSEHEPVIAKLLAQHPIEAVSNLTFSGQLAITASVERTRSMPVPVWTVKAPFLIRSVQLLREDRPIAISELSVTPGASGIAGHIDVTPIFPRAKSISVGNLVFTNMFASVRATEKALMVNEARAGFCGGKVSLYSLFLNTKTLNTGLTLFLEDVNAGEALTHLHAFNGKASGRLHGKLRLSMKEGGKTLRVKEAFLYSTPGEGGKIKMTHPETMTDNLAFAGIDNDTRNNVANALTDLDYSILKLDLAKTGSDINTLSIRIEGSATRGGKTVPVNLNLNISGEIDQLINTGLGYSRLLKGNEK